MDKTQWFVVIDTDSYSGNFERELASYITGIPQIRGEHLVKEIHEAYGFNSKVYGNEWDEHPENPFFGLFEYTDGEYGPELAHIHPTPGWGNDGNGKHKRIKVGCSSDKKNYPFPAYQSVIMGCFEKPTREQIEILREWSERFFAKNLRPWLGSVKLLGIRVIQRKTTETETEVEM